MKVLKKIVLATAAAAVAAGVSWGATANAAVPNAVTALNAHVDEITSVSAQFDTTALGATTVAGTSGTPLGSTHALTFSAAGTHGPLTWSFTEANFGAGWAFTPAGNVLNVIAPSHVSAPVAPLPTIVATVTDGAATAKDVLQVTSGTAILTGPNAGKVNTVTITSATDTVALSVANGGGVATFTTVPASVPTVLGGSVPAGIDFTGGVLSGGTTVPGLYHHLLVTASDAGGAKAVESFDAAVIPVKTPPPAPTTPFVYHGHVLTGDQHNATVGWLDGIPDNATAWGSGTVNGHVNHCVEVFVYGFDRPAGVAHVGFTCDNGNPAANVGYLRSLAPGHTYALFVQPATGTYGNNHPIPGTNPQAHITVITPA